MTLVCKRVADGFDSQMSSVCSERPETNCLRDFGRHVDDIDYDGHADDDYDDDGVC